MSGVKKMDWTEVITDTPDDADKADPGVAANAFLGGG
jgi:hypothetical protein